VKPCSATMAGVISALDIGTANLLAGVRWLLADRAGAVIPRIKCP
jgi:hypothetical protein